MSRPKLSRSMSQSAFDNGYWYALELREFAVSLGVPHAAKLRKDELERAIKTLLATGKLAPLPKRSLSKSGPRDVDLGLRPELPIVHYTSNKQTKDFIVEQARKLDPAFRRKPGTRYLLNRWREEQLASGKPITYGDLVRQAMTLNVTREGPLRIAHGRYMNFISDFMAANKGAKHAEAVRAWAALKKLDAPKTYAAWARHLKAKRQVPTAR
jgi:hypothetical protein